MSSSAMSEIKSFGKYRKYETTFAGRPLGVGTGKT